MLGATTRIQAVAISFPRGLTVPELDVLYLQLRMPWLTLDGVAQTCGVPRKTVDKRLERACQRLGADRKELLRLVNVGFLPLADDEFGAYGNAA